MSFAWVTACRGVWNSTLTEKKLSVYLSEPDLRSDEGFKKLRVEWGWGGGVVLRM